MRPRWAVARGLLLVALLGSGAVRVGGAGSPASAANAALPTPTLDVPTATLAPPSPTLQAATVTPARATPTLQAATVTPAPATPVPATPPPAPTTGSGVLADDRFTGPTTIMPLASGTLFLDSAGYEMVDAASNPNTVSATPLNLPALAAFSAAATLTLVSGDAAAGYGFRLGSGSVSFYVDLDQQGRFRVQRLQGNARVTLVDWTAQPAIRAGLATNRLSLEYAGGLLQISVNDAMAGFVELPGPPGALTVGLIDDGGKTTAQVRCTRFTVTTGPVVALDDRFGDNAAAWNLGPTFAIGGGILRMDPPPKTADVTTYPEKAPPSGGFTALATVSKVAGPDDQWVGGLAFLANKSFQYTFEIYGDGRFGVDYWEQTWHTLLRRSTTVLHVGNATNTLFARYSAGILSVGANGVVLATLPLTASPAAGQVGMRTEARDNMHVSHFLLLQPTSAATGALTPAPALHVDRSVLWDSFATDTGHWALYPTITAIHDHALRITVHDANTSSWANTKDLRLGTAYSVSATMRLSRVAHADSPYGLIFQVDPAGKGGEFLSFGITPDGHYDLGWLHHGSWQRDIVPYALSDLVMPGTAANRLRVDVLGGVAQLYLNGVRLKDARLPAGASGGQVGMMTTTGNDLEVEDVQVTRLIASIVPPVLKPLPRPTPQPQPIGPILNDPERVAKTRIAPSVVQVVVATLFAHNRPAYGTGLIVLSDHTGVYVLTAHHVVNHVFSGDAKRIRILLPGGAPVVANGLAIVPVQRGQGVSANADLALIRLPPRPGIHAAVLGDSSAVDSPEQVLAVGYPDIAGYSSTQPFVQTGALQNAREHVAGLPGVYLAHSAAVAEGMSGGPLVLAQSLITHNHDLLGQVIGINLDYARPVATGPQTIAINPALNLNLALPSNAVGPVLVSLLRTLHPGPYTLPR